jgi:DNA polymerase-3 subunit delta'
MFENIIGQDLAKKILENCIKSGRVPSALLFHGPDGVGKRTFALTLARILNCCRVEHGYCGECPSCKGVANLTHPDLKMIFPVKKAGEVEGLPLPEQYDEQGTITIDMVRELRKEASLRPFQEGKRVFIVLDADRMNEEATNAFLKLLEEPPADTLIILTTTRPSYLLATILSRCQRIPFRRLPDEAIENWLVEKTGADRDRAHLIASLANGSLGLAERMVAEFAEEHRTRLFDFILRTPPRDDLDILDFAQEVVKDDSVPETLGTLESAYRDMLALKLGAGDSLMNADQRELLEKGARSIASGNIYDIIYEIEDAFAELNRNVNPNLILFNLFSRVHEKTLSGA